MADEEVNQAEDLNPIIEAEMRCHQFAKEVLIAGYQRNYQETANTKYELPSAWTVGIKLMGFYFSKSMREEANISQQEWHRMLLFIPLLVPLFILFQLIVIAMLPWDYYENYQEKRTQLNIIKAYIDRLREWPTADYSPSVKTLKALWEPYHDHKLDIEDVIRVFNHWIELLYGEDVLKTIDLEALNDEIITSRVKANMDFYRRKPNSPHFYFAPLDESLVREVSSRLPAYG